MTIPNLKKITEETVVPLGLVIAAVGGVIWLTTILTNSEANTGEIKDLKERQDRYLELVQKIDQRLSRIEGKMGIK